MDFMTASITPNCTALSDKATDELKRVWKENLQPIAGNIMVLTSRS
jgi:hypothetical protein